MINKQRVGEWARSLEITVSEEMLGSLDRYAEAVARTNEMFNLTAIKGPEDMEIKNIMDSMSVVPFIPYGASVADVGTGAGFPGMVIKILRPDIELTLIEATDKKLQFVLRTAADMGISVTGCHMRSEEAGRGNMRGSFDVVTARAVAALPALLEYTLPLLKTGGKLLAMKGPAAGEEIDSAAKALRELRGKVEAVHPVVLPGGDERVIVETVLTAECPSKYPRAAKNIKKAPL
ncbi:MAG: 16S rRNA (guanine(527)-N(7))-methyltransferase RsmG [Oscillospiraceae bacterium]|nr:16S rRNA (guanine(527)-N(7))-methyltransferase RsmG [Oscillospiraceae bacterium]